MANNRKRMLLAVMAVQLMFCVGGCKRSENPASEMTTAEKLAHLTIAGEEIGFPCKVGDLPEGLELGYGIDAPGEDGWEDIASCQLNYQGEKIGVIFIIDCPLGDGKTDMSKGYEDKWIYNISIMRPGDEPFELFGITHDSTKQQVRKCLGEPTSDEMNALCYMDPGVDAAEAGQGYYDQIIYFFNEDGSIDWYCFTADMRKIDQ